MPKDDLLIGQPKPQTLRLSEHPSYKCECGCNLFTTAVVVKKVPGVLTGQADLKEVPVPVDMVPVMVCSKCGEIAPFLRDNEDFKKIWDKLNKDPEPETKVII